MDANLWLQHVPEVKISSASEHLVPRLLTRNVSGSSSSPPLNEQPNHYYWTVEGVSLPIVCWKSTTGSTYGVELRLDKCCNTILCFTFRHLWRAGASSVWGKWSGVPEFCVFATVYHWFVVIEVRVYAYLFYSLFLNQCNRQIKMFLISAAHIPRGGWSVPINKRDKRMYGSI